MGVGGSFYLFKPFRVIRGYYWGECTSWAGVRMPHLHKEEFQVLLDVDAKGNGSSTWLQGYMISSTGAKARAQGYVCRDTQAQGKWGQSYSCRSQDKISGVWTPLNPTFVPGPVPWSHSYLYPTPTSSCPTAPRPHTSGICDCHGDEELAAEAGTLACSVHFLPL